MGNKEVEYNYCIFTFVNENHESIIENKKNKIKIVAVPVLVIAAVLFFWLNSGSDEIKIDEGNSSAIEEDGVSQQEVNSTQSHLYVDIGGEVMKPGVYEVSDGTRLFEVIDKAGGLTEDADIDGINRAETVQDGQKIMIGRHGENPDENRDSYSANNVTDSGEDKVNINTADAAALQTIPGIGPSKADRIIEYRESEGKFNEIDDIKNISGIGNKTFESIKEYITV